MSGAESKGEQGKPEELVVFSVLTPAVCTECSANIEKGDLLRLEGGKPFCLECADLDHLVFLPSGDAALTRRSKKGSKLWAVILRFSKARGRYERQGLLVEPEALEAAEIECAGDADARAAARGKSGERREKLDVAYQAAFIREIMARYPKCPADEAETIGRHACQKHSGRVGRSAMAKELDTAAIDLAVRAHIRHVHTSYDTLLLRGVGRREAREQVAAKMDRVVGTWR